MPDHIPLIGWLCRGLRGIVNLILSTTSAFGNVPEHWLQEIEEAGKALLQQVDHLRGQAPAAGQVDDFEVEGQTDNGNHA